MLDAFIKPGGKIYGNLTSLKFKDFFKITLIGLFFSLLLGHPPMVRAAAISLSATPTSQTVNAGQAASYTI